MLATPLHIGPLRLASNLELAPIAGYCDLAFRTIVREWSQRPHGPGGMGAGSGVGVGLACTDLLSPQGLLRGTATSLDLAATNDFDKPVGMQLYGADPVLMAEAARWAVEHGATVVDINMGCPVDKVTKKDGGSKLLTDLSRAVGISAAVVKELERCPLTLSQWADRLGDACLKIDGAWHTAEEVRARGERGDTTRIAVPLTCKMRLCWSTADYEAGLACSPHLARMLAEVGVVGVTVHGRTTEMKFSGDVIRPGIARVVESVAGRIPVLGNGDVREPEDVVRMIRETGCAGVMIGRGALSTPWIFRDAWALQMSGVEGGGVPSEPTIPEKLASMRRYFDLMISTRGEHYAMVQMRRRIAWFAKRLLEVTPQGKRLGVKPLKEAVRLAKEPSEIRRHLDVFEAGGLRGGAFDEQEALA